VRDVALVDQSPAGKSSRANVATYVGAYDRVRRLLAGSREARRAGLTASSFSFNVQGGRCETCKGEGSERIEMQFLSDVRVTCPECRGRRFRAHVLEARVRGKNAVEILDLTVDDAAAFFAPADGPARRGDAAAVEIASLLDPLRRVGLGYLRLGQSLATLSGGEAQRLKLAEAIGRARSSAGNGRAAKSAAAEGAEPRSTVARGRGTLFFLDEPTVGLHLDDVRKLLEAFEALLAAGDSLVVVEHHVGVIRSADWVVDLGPEAGEGGGRVVAAGPPEAIAACADSHTGAALRAAGVVASRRNSSRSDSPRSGGVRLE
jgi:excinuclease ABC subunit A